MNRVRLAAVLAVCTAIMGIGASAAAAKTTTLHFFSKGVYFRISDASGNHPPHRPGNTPAVGDRFSIGSDDYVGNHKHHAKRATASDHLVCVLTTATGSALCDGQIAIGGSMLFADDFVIDFNSNAPVTVKLTGGTGRFRGAQGTIFAKSVNQNDTDLTIRVTT